METGPRFIVTSNGLEKPRIEPATPGLQGESHNHCTTEASNNANEKCMAEGITITCTFLYKIMNQRTNGPVNAHLKPEIYTCTNKLVRLEWYNGQGRVRITPGVNVFFKS